MHSIDNARAIDCHAYMRIEVAVGSPGRSEIESQHPAAYGEALRR